MRAERSAWHPEYREDGTVSRLLVTPPEEGPQFRHWLEYRFDESGRIAALADSTGNNVRFSRGRGGEVTIASSARGSILWSRNEAEEIQVIETSWGENRICRYALDASTS